MHTVNLLRSLVENHQVLVYFFIFVSLIVEGEVVLLSTGIFLHLGALNLPLVIIFTFLGVFGKTVIGYYLGVFLQKKFHRAKFLKYVEGRVFHIMPHFRQKPFWCIFVSKFIMGANNLIIVFSGYQRVDFKKYFKAEFYSTIIWAPALIVIGYFFSYTALHVSREIWRFSFIVLILTTIFLVFDKLVSWVYGVFSEFYYHGEQ